MSTDNPMDDLQALAGEYVLGTLSAGPRAEVQARLAHDTELRAAVQAWEARLLPLTAMVEPAEPSPALWGRIAQGLGTQPPVQPVAATAVRRGAGRWQRWWNNLNLWRAVAATGFAAASVMALLVSTRLNAPPSPQYMVVLVAPQGTAPGWVVQAGAQQRLRLIPVGPMAVPEARALQFWTKADDWKAPVSLGLVQPGQPLEVMLDKLPPLQPNQLFEITLEPPNGSPTGRPTGPILYIGRAVKMT